MARPQVSVNECFVIRLASCTDPKQSQTENSLKQSVCCLFCEFGLAFLVCVCVCVVEAITHLVRVLLEFHG